MEIRPRERAGSALVVGADDSLRGRIQPFQAVQRSANAGRVRFAALCRWHLKCESEPLLLPDVPPPCLRSSDTTACRHEGVAPGVGSIPSPQRHSSQSPLPGVPESRVTKPRRASWRQPCAPMHLVFRPAGPNFEWRAPNRSWRRKGSSSQVAGNVAPRVRGYCLRHVGSMV